MTHRKFFKYALLTNLILCGGLFIPLVGSIGNGHYRYLPYDIIQAPAFFIKKIVAWKFHDAEELAIWNSYSYVGPLLNLISSSVWTFIVLAVIKLFRRDTSHTSKTTSLWKTAYKLNLIIATIMFLLWLPMSDFFIRGISDNPLSHFQFYFVVPFEFFGIVTHFIASKFLETGGDTAFGFSDTELLSTLASSSGITVLCLLIAWIRWLILKQQKPAANKGFGDMAA